MIQATRDNDEDDTLNYIYVNIYDLMTSVAYKPLVNLVSNQTGKNYSFIPTEIDDVTYPSYSYGSNKTRYTKMTYRILKNSSGENQLAGHIYLGDERTPYGFYDFTIYQNKSNSNLDIAEAIKILYKGIFNFKAVNNNAVTYSEYTTNDSDTERVYITN